MKPISAIPVFHVKDVESSLSFYTDVLGFVQAFRYGTYVGLKIGKCEIHICPRMTMVRALVEARFT